MTLIIRTPDDAVHSGEDWRAVLSSIDPDAAPFDTLVDLMRRCKSNLGIDVWYQDDPLQTLWQLHECCRLHLTVIPYQGHPSQQEASP